MESTNGRKPGDPFPPPSCDYFLESLIDSANYGMEIPVTLFVCGVMISGQLVSGRKYFDGVAEQIAGAMGQRTAFETAYVSGVRRFADLYPSIASTEFSAGTSYDEEESPGDTEFVHLRNARILAAGSTQPHNPAGTWWRGRTCQISGFLFGDVVQNSMEGVPRR